MNETALLYALSTIAQTCAALAAFVGAVGIYRLRVLRDLHRSSENEIRASAALAGLGIDHRVQSLEAIIEFVEKESATRRGEPAVKRAVASLEAWRAVPPAIRRSQWALMIFEAWNLVVVGLTLVGFNYLDGLKNWPGTFWLLWIVAVGTVGVSVYGVFAWTKE